MKSNELMEYVRQIIEKHGDIDVVLYDAETIREEPLTDIAVDYEIPECNHETGSPKRIILGSSEITVSCCKCKWESVKNREIIGVLKSNG